MMLGVFVVSFMAYVATVQSQNCPAPIDIGTQCGVFCRTCRPGNPDLCYDACFSAFDYANCAAPQYLGNSLMAACGNNNKDFACNLACQCCGGGPIICNLKCKTGIGK